jgi:hypothetical protein
MSLHSFDPDIAKQVGINAAILYHNIGYWCAKNAANGRHIHEGRAWTYNSNAAFEALFTYLSGKQIRTALDKLEQAGLIKISQFNKAGYDRTRWFSAICPQGQMDLPSGANGFALKGEPIPVSKPVGIYIESEPWFPADAWQGFCEMRKQTKKPMTERAVKIMLAKLERMHKAGQDIEAVLDQSTNACWSDVYELKEERNGGNYRGGSQPRTYTDKRDGFTRAIDGDLGIG